MLRAQRIALASIAVGLLVLGIKTLAWWMTGSVALFSDALESIVNVATAIAALVAIRVAARPPDANHPYGHHKAELFSAVVEGALIVVAALVILREAWAGLLAPPALVAPLPGLAVNLAAGMVNGVWCWVLLREGRRLRSAALLADGRHLLADVVSSIGVTAGVLAAVVTGLHWLDPALAALVAANILWSGWRVIAASVGGLMDESLPSADLARLRMLILANAGGAVEAHDIRSRQAGRATFVEFHLVVSGEMTVDQSHRICDRIEAALRADIPDCEVTIHVEPAHKAKRTGIVMR